MERCVDVLIVGGGPVGLITAYQLAKFGGVSVAIIEKHAKSAQDAYGRSVGSHCGTTSSLTTKPQGYNIVPEVKRDA